MSLKDPIWGLDALGGVKFADLLKREMPERWMLGIFTNTFGDAYPLVEAIAKQDRVVGIRLNLAWSDNHTFTNGDFRKIQREAQKYAPLIRKFPQINWYVSGATEHQLSAADAAELYKIVSNETQGATYVNNPWQNKGAFLDATAANLINEVHGADASPPRKFGRFAYSCDGSDCFDFDIISMKEKMQEAEYFMFWCCQFNGRMKADDKTPRPQRKAWPTSELIDATIYLHNDAGELNPPKKAVVKPKADQHMVPAEPRALKPVVIIPQRGDRLEAVADNGQVVAVSERPQPFADGRFRYYFSQFGYQIAEKAKRIHGGTTVSLRINNKIIGAVNLAFRQGEFRK